MNWHARMASSAVWWDWGVTPAQQSDRISISVSGKAARSTMAFEDARAKVAKLVGANSAEGEEEIGSPHLMDFSSSRISRGSI